MSDPLYIDNSTLKAMATCSTQAALRYVYHRASTEESVYLKCGTAVHEALALHFAGETVDTCLATFDGLYLDYAAANVQPGDRLSHENVTRILTYWLQDHPAAEFPVSVPSPKFIEVGFQCPLDDAESIVYTGRMDLVVVDSTGALAPLDHKTTGQISAPWIERFRNDSQMSGYIWAATQHTGKPLTRAYVNAIELGHLPSDPVRKCAKHGIPYAECAAAHVRSQLFMTTRTPKQIEEWRIDAIRLAKRFRALRDSGKEPGQTPMEGSFTDACRFCFAREYCNTGRETLGYDTIFVEDQWNPLAYSQKGFNHGQQATGNTQRSHPTADREARPKRAAKPVRADQ